jgi:hypothetical protein
MPTYANHIYTYRSPGTFSLRIPFDADYMSILVVGGGGSGDILDPSMIPNGVHPTSEPLVRN